VNAAATTAGTGHPSAAAMLVLGLIIGVGVGLMYQRYLRSRRDLKGARAFVKTAARTHWRVSVPQLLAWMFIAACAATAAATVVLGR
jgi:hypothetical protein